MENDVLPQYMQIAISVARRIADGEVAEGTKLSGRSKLSSEYNVSPETIRKALRLLGDMRVVEVKEQSGVIVLSADNAKRYLHQFEEKANVLHRRRQLRELLEQQETASRQLAELCRCILDQAKLPAQDAETLPVGTCRVPEDWGDIGRNLGDLRFWQYTGATVVAIRRGASRIISPGPYAELYAGDRVVFVGDEAAQAAVERFFSEGRAGKERKE